MAKWTTWSDGNEDAKAGEKGFSKMDQGRTEKGVTQNGKRQGQPEGNVTLTGSFVKTHRAHLMPSPFNETLTSVFEVLILLHITQAVTRELQRP
ncbi:hypothetical protein GW7_07338 [Heterocephalus glaber]|uniref:Uncharacterized protein n=1 Tax=Heterocephalus glaber TaxID=10181 RepID=G5BKQ1_HETGA|nr:hypothetical protein GW7_07338 [Heterocephalus glaber]